MAGLKRFLFINIRNKYKISVFLPVFMLCMLITGNLFQYMVFMFFAFLHELAHILTALKFKAQFKSLAIYAAGFSASMDLYDLDQYYMFFVYIAGIMTNMTFSVIFIIIKIATGSGNLLINNIIMMNTLMFITNILPVKPLDGSYIVRLILQRFTGYVKSDKIVTGITIFLLPVLFALSLIQIASHLLNISLLLISTYIFLSYNQVDCEVFYMIFRKYQSKIKKIETGEAYEVREMIVNEKTSIYDVYKKLDKDKYHLIKVCDHRFKILKTVTEKNVIDNIMNGNGNELIGNVT